MAGSLPAPALAGIATTAAESPRRRRQDATVGAGSSVRRTARQSIPSSSIASSAGDRRTCSVAGLGQTNRPFSVSGRRRPPCRARGDRCRACFRRLQWSPEGGSLGSEDRGHHRQGAAPAMERRGEGATGGGNAEAGGGDLPCRPPQRGGGKLPVRVAAAGGARVGRAQGAGGGFGRADPGGGRSRRDRRTGRARGPRSL